MVFYALISAGPPREVLKPEPKGESSTPPDGHPLGPEGGVETRAWKGFNTSRWTSAGPRGRCWDTSLKGQAFNTSRWAQQMLMYQKSMFDCYYWIKHFFFAWKLWRNCFKTFFFTCTRKRTLPANILKMPLPGERLTSSQLCTLLMMTSLFMTAPECVFGKPQSRASKPRELPC